jgi:hypothetical protein
MSKEKNNSYMVYQTTTKIESENNYIFSLLTIVQKKKVKYDMYKWMYVYENVSYKSGTKEKRNVINTHNIYNVLKYF